MDVETIDHLVLYVEDVDRTCEWYERVAGARRETFAGGRVSLHFGDRKVNLHPAGEEYDPHAENPAPGAGDFCLIVETPIRSVVEHLEAEGVEVVEGPVEKTGVRGSMVSVYVYDPDGNLVEFARYG